MNYLIQRVIAIGGLVFAAPLLFVVAVAIAVLDGRPVYYKAHRIGRYGEPFTQWKFRSMIPDADRLLGELGTDAPAGRITRTGRVLRKTSLDELPQLLNVANGSMALVGPRPLLPEMAERIPDSHPRFSVLPGLTGLAQVSGRNMIRWSERLELDARYVRERSLSRDCSILVRTIRVVLGAQGISLDRNSSDVLDI